MTKISKIDSDEFLHDLETRTPNEDAFHQATREVVPDLVPLINDNDAYLQAGILKRLVEPDRVISFRVEWVDDTGIVQVNRGHRVQFNNAIGPYKGGLRFHPTVTPAVLKFLGFEQTFKNALTGLPMGGGKGGSDFDPSGRSPGEIMRFCQAFMMELSRHIGADVDIPAGDINVGATEIGYLFGAYARITGKFEGALTGKGLSFGGSDLRTEATGYGVIQFLGSMLEERDETIEDKTIVVSGAGNVATHAAELAVDHGGKVITLSDSNGFIHDAAGLTQEKINWVRQHKAQSGASLEAYADKFDAEWHADDAPWQIDCDIALPCATQNELDRDDVNALADNGCHVIVEGANMPVTSDGKEAVRDKGILFGPGKAANAGGVAVSGLEISQNKMRKSMTREELCASLKEIMGSIHRQCVAFGEDDGQIDYAKGANVAGFKKVAQAMLARGVF